MTKYELWNQIIEQNKSFKDKQDNDNITLSFKMMKKFFDLVWDTAEKNGEDIGYDKGIRVSKNINNLKSQNSNSYDDLFKGIFKK